MRRIAKLVHPDDESVWVENIRINGRRCLGRLFFHDPWPLYRDFDVELFQGRRESFLLRVKNSNMRFYLP